MSDPVLLSYSLDGLGGGVALHDGAISRLLKDDQLAWAHLNADHPDTAAWLRREVGYLDDFVVNALLADETRPRILPVGEGVLLILRGVNLNENASPEDMVSIQSEDFAVDRTEWGLLYNVEGSEGVPADYLIANDIGFTIDVNVSK